LRNPGIACGALVSSLLMAVSFGALPAYAVHQHYDLNTKDIWLHPPADWFLGDETPEMQGLTPVANLATPSDAADLEKNLKKIKLPPGFKIELWASNVPEARQMAWGDDGTLYVGSWSTDVYAIKDEGGKRTVKTILKGLNMPTGVAFVNGSLYVVAINRLLRYDKPEANLDKMPEPVVVYDDMPSYPGHGWKYLADDHKGSLYFGLGPPFNIGIPPTSVSQIRKVDYNNNYLAEIVAVGVRNSVGGDIDPRSGDYWFTENARDWVSDDLPSDKLNHVARFGEHFGYPYCHQGDLPDPKFNLGHKCSEFTPPVVKLGAHVAPLGMKFYTGTMFPQDYSDNIFIAEHGSWTRHVYQGGRIERVIVDPDGQNARQEVFAEGWIIPPHEYWGRPNDVIQAKDGSLLVSDDYAGAIYRISYQAP
jgi:glucose/arabinose dehydrogenase